MNTILYLIRFVIAGIATIVAGGSCIAKEGELELGSVTSSVHYKQVLNKLENAEFTGAIVIASQNDDLFFAGFGDKATVNGRPDEKTLVDIGSITKTVTAVAALSLVDQGKLSMSDSLSKFFPSAPKEKLSITVHQLLTHSSGLINHVANDGDGISKAEFLKRTMNSKLLFEPGENYEYSNAGYSLVAAIIEQISNFPYEEFVRKVLLKDINALSVGYQTGYVSDHSMLTPEGETIAQNSWDGSPGWELIGNGGLVARPIDLAHFLKKLNEGKIISLAALELLRTPHVQEGVGAPSYYGYGAVVEDHPKYGRVYWHNGSNGIFSATWVHYLDQQLFIVTASNSPKLNSDKVESIVVKEVLHRNSNKK